MRDPQRINRILNELRQVWLSNPDLRLGQLVCNAAMTHTGYPIECNQVFYIEDEDLIEAIKKG